MPAYDTVYVVCPRCCRELESQSKAGKCDYGKYPLAHAPAELVADIQNTALTCGPPCNTRLMVRMSWSAHVEVVGSTVDPRNRSESNCVDDWT